MSKMELKTVQTELEKGQIWPFYWLYGPERMKSRELLKRIRVALFGNNGGSSGWNEETFEGAESDGNEVLEALMSPSLYSGVKLVLVREAHALKNVEVLLEVLGPPQSKGEVKAVCVCFSKDLDARKKFSKVLLEKAAVVSCEEVADPQKDAWIQFLAKKRGFELNSSLILQLCSLDPWSLDIVDQELEKYALADSASDVILKECRQSPGVDVFLAHFFQRDLKSALPLVSRFAENPEDALPLLGLFAWNVRQLCVELSDQERGTRYAKLNSYVMDQFRRWGRHWKLTEIVELQEELARIDFSFKQTPLLPLGLWTRLVTRFCR